MRDMQGKERIDVIMKREGFQSRLGFLLLSAGCSASTDPQSLAALENVMAVAAYSDELPEEPPAADPVCWDGDYGNGSRTITLSLGANGSLHYRVSDGGVGCAAEVNGTAAKTSSLCFSLSGDTLQSSAAFIPAIMNVN